MTPQHICIFRLLYQTPTPPPPPHPPTHPKKEEEEKEKKHTQKKSQPKQNKQLVHFIGTTTEKIMFTTLFFRNVDK